MIRRRAPKIGEYPGLGIETWDTRSVERRCSVRLENRGEFVVGLTDAAARGRRGSISRTTAVIAAHGPHRQSRDVAVGVCEIQQSGGIREREDLAGAVILSNHRSDSNG